MSAAEFNTAMDAEAKRWTRPIQLDLDLHSTFIICSLLQVALRHPTVRANHPAHVAIAETLVRSVRDTFEREGFPVLAKAIDMGFDPNCDV